MPKIVEYKKQATQLNMFELRGVEGTELCTLGDTTYFVIPGTVLPTGQAVEIQSSIKATALTDQLNDQIRAASPHCKLIARRMREKLAEAGYSEADTEFYLHLSAAGTAGVVTLTTRLQARLVAYLNAFKAAHLWAEARYADLGL